jgi:hypothetical protein
MRGRSVGKQCHEFAEAAHPRHPHIHSGGVATRYDNLCNARGAGLPSQEKAAPLAPPKQSSPAARALRGIIQSLTSRTSANCRPVGEASSFTSSRRLVDGCVRLQTRDLVLHSQLATLQCHDLQIIDRRMGLSFVDLRLEGPVTSFQFGKMSFDGHVLGFSSVSCD